MSTYVDPYEDNGDDLYSWASAPEDMPSELEQLAKEYDLGLLMQTEPKSGFYPLLPVIPKVAKAKKQVPEGFAAIKSDQGVIVWGYTQRCASATEALMMLLAHVPKEQRVPAMIQLDQEAEQMWVLAFDPKLVR